MATLERAISIAAEGHAGQVDNSGWIDIVLLPHQVTIIISIKEAPNYHQSPSQLGLGSRTYVRAYVVCGEIGFRAGFQPFGKRIVTDLPGNKPNSLT